MTAALERMERAEGVILRMSLPIMRGDLTAAPVWLEISISKLSHQIVKFIQDLRNPQDSRQTKKGGGILGDKKGETYTN